METFLTRLIRQGIRMHPAKMSHITNKQNQPKQAKVNVKGTLQIVQTVSKAVGAVSQV